MIGNMTESDVLAVMIVAIWGLVCVAAIGLRFGF
jgi:hypothetical protein